MANQKSKIIDVTQSYIPVDPQAFPETLGLTAKEDDPAKDMTILAYEGYNFLPTSYGYRSYFSTSTLLSFDALTTPCDKILSFQSKTYENTLLAFCSDGVYMVKAGETAWTKIWALTDTWTVSQIYSQYTWTVIENTLYIYRQGAANVLKVLDDLTYTLITPTFLNMAGQMGIFKANGSLAFWDSENSIAWSNVFDLTDFEPSVENLVGNTIFFGVQGRIVHVQDHGDGFVIYATKSIVGVTYSNTSTAVWDAGVVTSESGIAHPGAITVGTTNQEHFVYTSTGIMKIGHYNALSRKFDSAPILPELFDYLRESRSPVYLACHAARFLYFSLVDADYINGRTSFSEELVPDLAAPPVTVDQTLIDEIVNIQVAQDLLLSGKSLYQVLNSYFANPNADVPENLRDSTTWIVCMQIPNSSHTAVFTPDYDYQEAAPTSAAFTTRASAASSIVDFFDVEEFLTGVITIAEQCQEYIERLSGFDGIQDTNFPYLGFTSPSVYNGVAKADLWDLIYNWFASIDELQDALVLYNEARIADLSNVTPFTIAYRDDGNTTPNNDYSTIVNTFYIPKKSSHVDVTIDDVAKQVTLKSEMHSYYKYQVGLTPSITTELGKHKWIVTLQLVEGIDSHQITLSQLSFPSIEDVGLALSGSQGWFNANTGQYRKLADLVSSTHPKYWDVHTPYNCQDASALGPKPIILQQDNYNIIEYATVDYYMVGNTSYYLTVETDPGRYTVDVQDTNYTVAYRPATAMKVLAGSYVKTNFSNHYKHLDYLDSLLPIPERYAHPNTSGYIYPIISFITEDVNGYVISRIDETGVYFNDGSLGGESPAYQSIYTEEHVDGFPVGGDLRWRAFLIDYQVHGNAFDYVHEITYSPSVTITEILGPDNPDEYEYDYLGSLQAVFTYSGYQGVSVVEPIPDLGNDYSDTVWDSAPAGTTYTFPVDLDYGESVLTTGKQGYTWDVWHLHYITATESPVILSTSFMKHTEGTMVEVPMPLGPLPLVDEIRAGFTYEGGYSANLYELANSTPETDFFGIYIPHFVYAGTSYTIQDGVPIPAYPTKKGALVFDLQLKRWGKYKGDHKALVEYAPINSVQNAVIPYTNFGMDSGILDASGAIKVFSASTADSYIRYGKIGYYRFGVSRLMEVRLHFRTRSTGKIVLDASLEGRNIDTYLQAEEVFTNTLEHIMYCDINAKWFTISIHGQYDLQYVEFRGNMTSRR